MSAINQSVTNMIQANQAKAPEEPKSTDERVRNLSPWRILLDRPELGSIAGTVLVFAFFGVFAGGSGMFALDGIINWAQVAGYLGIIAVGACLLMIAGEFDLSMGSMIGFAGVMVAIPPMYLGWPLWAAVIFAFVGSMATMTPANPIIEPIDRSNSP